MREVNETPGLLLALSVCAVVAFNMQYWAIKSTPVINEHCVFICVYLCLDWPCTNTVAVHEHEFVCFL